MVSPITEADIFERKEEFMVSPTGGIPCKRIAHFLKPIVSSSPKESKLKQPFLSPKSNWPLDVAFNGWLEPFKKWSEWVDEMHSQHSLVWKRAGILEAILGSKCNFHRVDDLIFGLAERWNCDTNTFVFPWGESTITLEDMMILGGFSVLGAPVFSLVKDENVARICMDLSEVLIKKRIQTHLQWLNYFKNKGSKKHEHEAFLSLWLLVFVFPGTEYDKVGDEVIPIAVYLAKGTKIALAPAALASIYRDMNVLKVSMDAMESEEGEGNILAVSLWAPLYLVQIWAWERFVQFRPDPNPLNKGDPRVARWDGLERLDIGNVRPMISSSGDVFLWRPYCLSVDNWPFPKFYKEKQEWTCIDVGECLEKEVESYVMCMSVCVLFGIECEEPYNPHRVAMQFGFDQDIPASIPPRRSKSSVDNSRPFRIASKVELPPRLNESDVSSRYLDWWRNDVLGPPLESFEGLARNKRTCRHKRKQHILNAEKVQNDYSVLHEEIGCKPKCADFMQVKIKTEAPDLDVPPGCLPIAKITQIQDSKLQESNDDDDARIGDNEEVIKDDYSSSHSETNVSSSSSAVGTCCGRLMKETSDGGLSPQTLGDMEARLERIERLLIELKNQMTKPVVVMK